MGGGYENMENAYTLQWESPAYVMMSSDYSSPLLYLL